MFLKLCRVYLKDYSLGKMLQVSGSKTKKILIGVLLVYAAVTIFGTLGYMFFNLAEVLSQINSLHVLIGFLGLYSLFIPIMMTLFRASGTLFFYKDYDIVAPLPIKSHVVFSAKLFVMILWMYAFSLVFTIPLLFSYFYFLGFDIIGFLMFIPAAIVFPLIPIVLMTFISLLIGYIATKFNFGKMLQIILLFAVFFGILILQFNMSSTDNPLVGQIDGVSGLIDQYLPITWFVEAIYDHNLLSLLYLVLSHVIVFTGFVLSAGGVSEYLNRRGVQKHLSHTKKVSSMTQRSLSYILIKKEFNKFFSIPIYVLNAGFGLVLLIGLAIASFFVDLSEYLQVFQALNLDIYLVIAMILGFIISLLYTPGISLSLEGKNFWVIKSLPIKAEQVMLSKIWFNVILGLPVIFISIILFYFSVSLAFMHVMSLIMFSTSALVLISFIDGVINLYFPKMDFKNEVEVVKQSLGAFLAMIAGLTVIATNVLLFVWLDAYMTEAILFLLISVINGLLILPFYDIIKRKSEGIFQKL